MTNNRIILTAKFSLFLLAVPIAMWGYAGGPLPGYTTAPGDHPGVACTACHSKPLNPSGEAVSVDFPTGLTYVPGQTRKFTLHISYPNATLFGFQITARIDATNAQAGNFTPVSTADGQEQVICSDDKQAPCATSDGLEWVEHFQAPFHSGTIPIQWTAPPSGSGNVHIYVAANASDHFIPDVAGGHIATIDYMLTPASGGGVPSINSPNGVTNAASGTANIQSGSFVTIYGQNFSTVTQSWDGAISSNGALPTDLGGASVTVDGNPAAISFASPGQINILAPTDANTGPVNVSLTNSNGQSAPVSVQLMPASPAFFTFSEQGGKYIAAQIAEPNASVIYLAPPGALGPGVSSQAAKPGDTIVLYGTGFGPTNPPVDPTHIFVGAAPTVNPVTLTIGGQPVTPLFAGISATGLYQINAVVPQLSNGDQPVVATVAGISTSQAVFINVTSQ